MKVLLASSTATLEDNRELLSTSKLDIIFLSTLEFMPIRKQPLDLNGYEWLIISSRKVYDFLSLLACLDSLSRMKIAVVGKATARYLEGKGLKVHFISSTHTSQDFAREFSQKFPIIKGKILRPVSQLAPKNMEKIMRQNGLGVDSIPIYTSICPAYPSEKIEEIKKGGLAGVLFTSPSSWQNFKRIFGKDWRRFLDGKKIGVIGSTTADALEKDGYNEYLMPETYTLAELVKTMEGELL